jgi:hypothetical protein
MIDRLPSLGLLLSTPIASPEWTGSVSQNRRWG